MSNVIQIQYNPYIPRLSILINNRRPSEFSQLIQYTDEDIWQWGTKLLDVLYAELRDDFYISFIGTEQDARVLRFLCARHKHCRGFHAKPFPISDPLQLRMKKLNQYLKTHETTAYHKTIIDATFMLPVNMHKYMDDIVALDINNLFCSVKVGILGVKDSYTEKENGILFLLTDLSDAGIDSVRKLSLHKPTFIIELCEDVTELVNISDTQWVYKTTESDLFETIFSCFLHIPLLLAFRNCIQSLSGTNTTRELKRISCIEPLLDISVADAIEEGKSTKINFSLDPAGGQVPELNFKIRNQHVASCDGMCVFGLQEGTSVLEAYRSGEGAPFFVKEIKVYKRNRITRIILSDDSLILGLNDKKKLTCDYAPADADNANVISWTSSDPSVVKVDGQGQLIASGIGQCRIICVAENVSAQCFCTVKPYLSSISVNIPLEDGSLKLEPMDEYKLSIELSPKDCIDGKILVETSDYNVVNAFNYVLQAKNVGTALITVRNINSRINQTFSVVVAKKKVGFFQKLFGQK